MIESPTGRFGVLGRLSSFPVFSMRSGSATLISTCFILLVTFSFANAEAPPVHVQTQHDNCSDPNNHIAEETKETVKCMELSTYIVDRGFVPDMTVDFYQKHTNESNRFKIALFWEERSDLKQLDCPVIRYSCCSGWEDALCDRQTCDDCCLRKGLKCSMSGTCVCPPGSSGPCCDNDEQQSEHAAVNQTQAVFFDLPQTESAPYSTCVNYGSMFRTFDGRSYKFRMNCRYILAMDAADNYQDTKSSWTVEAQSVNCDTPKTCRKKIWINLPTTKIVAIGAEVTVDGTKIPDERAYIQRESGVNIQRDGDFTFLTTSMGLRVKWDKETSVFVTVDGDKHRGNAYGLCGYFNGKPTDDFTPFGQEPTEKIDFQKFIESWKTSDGGPCTESLTHDSCGSTERQLAAELRCSQPLQGEEFKAAVISGLATDWYIKACSFDLCALNGKNAEDDDTIVCHYLSAYAMDASKQGLRLSNWRKPGLCDRKCPANQEFTECRSSCPQTCGMKDRAQDEACYAECHPGCECKNGYYLDKGECVRVENCSCYHNRLRYGAGDTIKQNCHTCTCEDGEWRCSEEVCLGTCAVVGHSQYRTFDGKTYRYRSQCEHSLVEPLEGDDGNIVKFAVYQKKFDCAGDVCKQKLRIRALNSEVLLQSDSDDIFVNGVGIVERQYRNQDVAVSRSNAFYTTVTGPGWQVLFNHDSSIYITLTPEYAIKVRGLCGYFDWKAENEFLSSTGLQDTNIGTFAFSYLTYKDVCEETEAPKEVSYCAKNPQIRDAAIEVCRVIQQRNGAFAGCQSVVPQETLKKQLELCVELTCEANDLHAACISLADLAHLCANEGANVTWSSDSALRKQCSSVFDQCRDGRVYSDCSDPCGSTCQTATTDAPRTCLAAQGCIAGCDCPAGTIYDEFTHSCVAQSDCSCFDPFTRETHRTGQTVKRGCNTCTCTKGHWKCSTHECVDNICPGNQQLLDNVSPCRLTCANFDRLDQTKCPGSTYKGCGCPEGTVLQGDRCVKTTECPCHHSGKEYAAGSSLKKDCNLCQCQGKFWNCTEELCEATCLATGDPHYVTFDGSAYSFEGRCTYVLAQHKDGNGASHFEVQAQNIPCGSSGVTCTKQVDVFIYEPTHLHLSLLRGRDLLVNDTPTALPYELDYAGVRAYQVGQWLTLTTKLGMRIMWDGATRVQITVRPNLKHQLNGLCGSYNGRSADDMTTPSGDVEQEPYAFASSWRTEPSCQDYGDGGAPVNGSCDRNRHRRAWAERSCRVISHSAMFQRCRDEIGNEATQRYHEWCQEDSCACDSGGDCECLCTAISAFADQCSRAGIAVRWRSQDLCPMQCENGQIYTACGSACPQTCSALAGPKDDFCSTECVEGCFCPEGMALHENQCVPQSDCPCHHDNREFQPGSFLKKFCQDCLCLNGTWDCHGAMCANETTCNPEEFRCLSDARCVPKSWVCDKTADCQDGSDETNCVHTCPPTEMQCTDGSCIPKHFKCDGTPDCSDGLDESHCPMPECAADEYTCKSGSCLPFRFRCDGSLDCGPGDDSDENDCEPCAHNIRYFRCGSASTGQCLPISLKCDGHNDCGDMSDETNCTCTCVGQYTCGNCECLSPLKRCDGVVDCDTDEKDCGCAAGQFACNNGTCIERSQLCDGVAECSESEDEKFPLCATTPAPSTTPSTNVSHAVTCGPNFMVCDDGTCVHGARCDSVVNCADASDEKNCLSTVRPCTENEFSCSDGHCISFDDVCDNVRDCADGSDERNCALTTGTVCKTGEFTCKHIFQCLSSMHFVCDGDVDCADGTDEQKCVSTSRPWTTIAPSVTIPPPQRSPVDCVYKITPRDFTPDTVREFEGNVKGEVTPDGAFTITFPNDRTLTAVEVKTPSPSKITVQPLDASQQPLPLPNKLFEGTPSSNATELPEPVEEVRSVKLTDESGAPLKPENVLEITVFACESAPSSTTPSGTPTTTQPPRQCLPGFAQCSDSQQCIPVEFICDNQMDCRDHTDEAPDCTVPPTQPPRPCEYYLTKWDARNPSGRKDWPEGTFITFTDKDVVTYTFAQPTGVSQIVVVATADTLTKVSMFDEKDELRGPPQVVRFDWYNYYHTFPEVVAHVKKIVLEPAGPANEGEEPALLFNMVTACAEVRTTLAPGASTVAPTTVPPEGCSEFICKQEAQCLPQNKVCNGQFDCADHTDEDDCAPVTTPAPPGTLKPPVDCVFKITGTLLSDMKTHLFDGAQISATPEGQVQIAFDQPRKLTQVIVTAKTDAQLTIQTLDSDNMPITHTTVTAPKDEPVSKKIIPVAGDVHLAVVNSIVPSDLSEIEFIACTEPVPITTTLPPSTTTVKHIDCMFRVEEDDWTVPSKQFEEGEATIPDNKTVEFTFKEPRPVGSVTVETKEPTDVTVIFTGADGKEQVEVKTTEPNKPVFFDEPKKDIISVEVVVPSNGTTDLKVVEVNACEKPVTNAPSFTLPGGVPGSVGPTRPIPSGQTPPAYSRMTTPVPTTPETVSDCVNALDSDQLGHLTNQRIPVSTGVEAYGRPNFVIFLLAQPTPVYGASFTTDVPTRVDVSYHAATGAPMKTKTGFRSEGSTGGIVAFPTPITAQIVTISLLTEGANFTAIELLTCQAPTTVPMPSTPTPQCLMEFNAADLTTGKKELPEGVTAEVTSTGAILYTFPEPRSVPEIVFKNADNSAPLQATFVQPDGTKSQPIPLTKSVLESLVIEAKQPNVGSVLIERTDSKPITPDDLDRIVVISCLHQESTTPGLTTPSPKDCIYKIKSDDVPDKAPEQPKDIKEFEDVKAIYNPDGTITYEFKEPRTLHSVISKTPSTLVIVPVNADGTEESPVKLPAENDERTETPINADHITKVIVKKEDNTPLTPGDVGEIEVIACKPQTTPSTGCIFKMTSDDIPEQRPTEPTETKTLDGGVTVTQNPDGSLTFEFPEPRELHSIVAENPAGLVATPVNVDGVSQTLIQVQPSLDEVAETPVNVPQVTKVVITKSDGTPITRKDIVSISIIACLHKGPGCIYKMTSNDVPEQLPTQSTPKTHHDGVKVSYLPDGLITFEFPEPRQVHSIIAENPAALVAQLVDSVGSRRIPINVPASPEESAETPVNVPRVTMVTIAKADGTPITRSDIVAIEVIACLPHPTSDQPSKPNVCIYPMTGDDLPKQLPTAPTETKTYRDGVTTTYGTDGTISYVFDEPRNIPFIVAQNPTPLTATLVDAQGTNVKVVNIPNSPEEAAETPVNVPNVTKVVIGKPDGTPVTAQDIDTIEVIACLHPGHPENTCIYEMRSDDVPTEPLKETKETKTFNDGVTTSFNPDGSFTFNFPTPRFIDSIIAENAADLIATTVTADGVNKTTVKVPASLEEMAETPVNVPQISKVIISKLDGTPVSRTDIVALDVIACLHKPGEAQPTTNCLFEMTEKDMKNGRIVFEGGVEATLKPDQGVIEYTFPTPRTVKEVVAQATENRPVQLIVTPVRLDGKQSEPLVFALSGEDEAQSLPIDQEDISKIVIAKQDGSPLKPEDLKSFNVAACQHFTTLVPSSTVVVRVTTPSATVVIGSTTPSPQAISTRISYTTLAATRSPLATGTPPAAAPAQTTTSVLDCIYAATPEKLADGKPVPFEGGTTVELNPKGEIEYKFPEPRPLNEIKIETTEPLQVVVEFPNGTLSQPIPLTPKTPEPNQPQTFDEFPKEFDQVVKVIISKPDKTPLKPTDVPFVEVVACKEKTTVAPGETTPASPVVCDYEVKPETVQQLFTYADGVTATLKDTGLEFVFPQARDVKEVIARTPDADKLVVVPFDVAGKELSPIALISNKNEDTATPVDQTDIKRVVVKKSDGSPLTPNDFTGIHVIACQHPATTTPSYPATTTAAEEDCLYEATKSDLEKPQPAEVGVGVTADVTPTGTLEFRFESPRTVTDIKIQTTTGEPLQVQFISTEDALTPPTPIAPGSSQPENNPVDESNVLVVRITRPDGQKLSPSDIVTVTVEACLPLTTSLNAITLPPHMTMPPDYTGTTPPMPTFPPTLSTVKATTTTRPPPAHDCVFELDAADLKRGSETFKDAQSIVTKSTNTVTTVFQSPRFVTEIHLQTDDASTVDVTVTDKNGVEQTVSKLPTGVASPKVTDLPMTFSNIVKLIVTAKDVSALQYLEVVACEAMQEPMGSTTPHTCLEPLSSSVDVAAVFSASSELPQNAAKQARLDKAGWIPEPSDNARYLDVTFPSPIYVNAISVKTTASNVTVQVEETPGVEQFELVTAFEKKPEEEPTAVLEDTKVFDAPRLTQKVRFHIGEGSPASSSLNVEVHGCQELITEAPTTPAINCLHFINPDDANGSPDKPSYVNDMIIVPEANGSIAVYFNGPATLSDVVLQTEKGGKFELLVSQDGADFVPFTDADGKVHLVTSGLESPVRNKLDTPISAIRAVRLSPLDNNNNNFTNLELNACVEQPPKVTEPTTTREPGFGGGVETTTTQAGFSEATVDYSECTERLHIKDKQFTASSGEASNAVVSDGTEQLYWTAADGDTDESLTIDLGYPMDVTGFLIKTTTVVKVKVQYSMDGVNFHGNQALPAFNALLTTDGSENQVVMQNKDITSARYIRISAKEKLNVNFPSDLPFMDLLPDLPKSNGATLAVDVFACEMPTTVPLTTRLTTPSIVTAPPTTSGGSAATTNGIVSQHPSSLSPQEFTTPSGESRTSGKETPLPCLHFIDANEILKGIPITYPESGAVAKLLPEGSILLTYTEPRILESVSTKAAKDFVILPLLNSAQVAPTIPLKSGQGEYVETEIANIPVTAVIIKKSDGSSIQPQELDGIKIHACQQATTTQMFTTTLQQRPTTISIPPMVNAPSTKETPVSTTGIHEEPITMFTVKQNESPQFTTSPSHPGETIPPGISFPGMTGQPTPPTGEVPSFPTVPGQTTTTLLPGQTIPPGISIPGVTGQSTPPSGGVPSFPTVPGQITTLLPGQTMPPGFSIPGVNGQSTPPSGGVPSFPTVPGQTTTLLPGQTMPPGISIPGITGQPTPPSGEVPSFPTVPGQTTTTLLPGQTIPPGISFPGVTGQSTPPSGGVPSFPTVPGQIATLLPGQTMPPGISIPGVTGQSTPPSGGVPSFPTVPGQTTTLLPGQTMPPGISIPGITGQPTPPSGEVPSFPTVPGQTTTTLLPGQTIPPGISFPGVTGQSTPPSGGVPSFPTVPGQIATLLPGQTMPPGISIPGVTGQSTPPSGEVPSFPTVPGQTTTTLLPGQTMPPGISFPGITGQSSPPGGEVPLFPTVPGQTTTTLLPGQTMPPGISFPGITGQSSPPGGEVPLFPTVPGQITTLLPGQTMPPGISMPGVTGQSTPPSGSMPSFPTVPGQTTTLLPGQTMPPGISIPGMTGQPTPPTGGVPLFPTVPGQITTLLPGQTMPPGISIPGVTGQSTPPSGGVPSFPTVPGQTTTTLLPGQTMPPGISFPGITGQSSPPGGEVPSFPTVPGQTTTTLLPGQTMPPGISIPGITGQSSPPGGEVPLFPTVPGQTTTTLLPGQTMPPGISFPGITGQSSPPGGEVPLFPTVPGQITTLLPGQTMPPGISMPGVTGQSTPPSGSMPSFPTVPGQTTTTLLPGQTIPPGISFPGITGQSSPPGGEVPSFPTVPGQTTTTLLPGQTMPPGISIPGITGQPTPPTGGVPLFPTVPGQTTTTVVPGHSGQTMPPGYTGQTTSPAGGVSSFPTVPGQTTTTLLPGQTMPPGISFPGITGQSTPLGGEVPSFPTVPGQTTTTAVPGHPGQTVPPGISFPGMTGQPTPPSGEVTSFPNVPGQTTTTFVPGGVPSFPTVPGQTTTTLLPGQTMPPGISIPGITSQPTSPSGTAPSFPTIPGQTTTTTIVSGGVSSLPTIPGQPTTIVIPGHTGQTMPPGMTGQPTPPSGEVTSFPTVPGQTTTTIVPGGVSSFPTVPGQTTTTLLPGQTMPPGISIPGITGQPTPPSGTVPTFPTVPGQTTTTIVPGGVSSFPTVPGQTTTTIVPGGVSSFPTVPGLTTTTLLPGQTMPPGITIPGITGQPTPPTGGVPSFPTVPGQITTTVVPGGVSSFPTVPGQTRTTLLPGHPGLTMPTGYTGESTTTTSGVPSFPTVPGQTTTTRVPGGVSSFPTVPGQTTTTIVPGGVPSFPTVPGQTTTTLLPGQTMPPGISIPGITGQPTPPSGTAPSFPTIPGQTTTTIVPGGVSSFPTVPGQTTTTLLPGQTMPPGISIPGITGQPTPPSGTVATFPTVPGQTTTTIVPGGVSSFPTVPGQTTTTLLPGQTMPPGFSIPGITGQPTPPSGTVLTFPTVPGQTTTTIVPGGVSSFPTVPGQTTTTLLPGQTMPPGISIPGITGQPTPPSGTVPSFPTVPGQTTTTLLPGQTMPPGISFPGITGQPTPPTGGVPSFPTVPGQITTTILPGGVPSFPTVPGQTTTTLLPGQTMPPGISIPGITGQPTPSSGTVPSFPTVPGQTTTTIVPGGVSSLPTIPGQTTTTSVPGGVSLFPTVPGQTTTTPAPGDVSSFPTVPGQTTTRTPESPVFVTTAGIPKITGTTGHTTVVVITSESVSVVTTSSPLSCIYEVRGEALVNGPVGYAGGNSVKIVDGSLLFEFRQPRTVSEVVAQTKDGRNLVVSTRASDDKVIGADKTAPSNSDVPLATYVEPAEEGVQKILFSSSSPITPQDIVYVKVVACKEQETTLMPPTTPTTPRDGEWTPWTEWSTCSVTCGAGSQTRKRECADPAPSVGGKGCRGESQEMKDCTAPKCTGSTPIAPGSTTPSAHGEITTPPTDCVYQVNPEQLTKQPRTFDEGVTVEFTPDGTIEYTFPTPRDITNVKVQSPSPVELVLVPVYQNGTQGAPQPLNSAPSKPSETPLNQPDVVRVIVKPANDQPLKPTDITTVEVVACEHVSSTTPRGVTTQPGATVPETAGQSTATTTVAKLTTVVNPECDYSITGERLMQNTPKVFEDASVQLNADGDIVFKFDEPKLITGVYAQASTNTHFDILPQLNGRPNALLASDVKKDEPVETVFKKPVVADELVVKGSSAKVSSPGELIRLTIFGCTHATSTVVVPSGANTTTTITPTTLKPIAPTSVTTAAPSTTASTTPMTCEYLPWSEWSPCSKTCELGQQVRSRSPINAHCENSAQSEVRDCNPDPCPVECVWSQWTPYTPCSASCNGGSRSRSREVQTPAKNGGADCIGEQTQSESCNSESCSGEAKCESNKVWTECAHKCPLTCADLAHENATCIEDEDCQPGCRCPADMVENDKGVCVHRNECACYDKYGKKYEPGFSIVDEENCRECKCTYEGLVCEKKDCAVDCAFSDWTNWGTCSATCDGGVQFRYRSADQPAAANGGKECVGPKNETRPCNEIPCQTTPSPVASTSSSMQNASTGVPTTTTTQPPKYCQLSTIKQDLSTKDGCSAKAVELTQCGGSCPSIQMLTLEPPYTINNCACCQGPIATKKVEFECENGTVKKFIDVPFHTACACNVCGDAAH